LLQRAWKGIVAVSRDNARTPVQWNAEANAGFTDKDATPWMRVNDNYKSINMAQQLNDPLSVRSFWKRVLGVRKEFQDVLIKGLYQVHDYDNQQTFVFSKTIVQGVGRTALVMLNFSDREADVDFPGVLSDREFELCLCNVEKPGNKLGAWEARLYVEQCELGEGWVVVPDDEAMQ